MYIELRSAKLLKELGFDELVNEAYNLKEINHISDADDINDFIKKGYDLKDLVIIGEGYRNSSDDMYNILHTDDMINWIFNHYHIVIETNWDTISWSAVIYHPDFKSVINIKSEYENSKTYSFLDRDDAIHTAIYKTLCFIKEYIHGKHTSVFKSLINNPIKDM